MNGARKSFYYEQCCETGTGPSLPPASEGWGKVMFSLCLSVHTRVLSQVSGPGSFLGVPQSRVLSQVSGPRSFLGEGVPQSQVLSQVSGPMSFPEGLPQCQVLSQVSGSRSFPRVLLARIRVPPDWDWGTPSQDWCTPSR